MKPALSVIALRSEREHLMPLLESLPEQSLNNLEVLVAGPLPVLSAPLERSLTDKKISLRLLPAANGSLSGHSFWTAAVAAARADRILHIDGGTRLLPGTALEENLNTARADMLHFPAPGGSAPQTGGLSGQEIVRFFLHVCPIDTDELTNKIYSRGLCRKACGILGATPGLSGNNLGGPHLLLGALAGTYNGQGKRIAEYTPRQRGPAEHAEHAAALYAAFALLPDVFVSLGHTEEVVTLARKRLRAEFSFAFGRACRRQNAVETSGEELLVLLREAFGKEQLTHALLLATARNAEKAAAVYRVLYGESLFDPCPAYGVRHTDSTPWRLKTRENLP